MHRQKRFWDFTFITTRWTRQGEARELRGDHGFTQQLDELYLHNINILIDLRLKIISDFILPNVFFLFFYVDKY